MHTQIFVYMHTSFTKEYYFLTFCFEVIFEKSYTENPGGSPEPSVLTLCVCSNTSTSRKSQVVQLPAFPPLLPSLQAVVSPQSLPAVTLLVFSWLPGWHRLWRVLDCSCRLPLSVSACVFVVQWDGAVLTGMTMCLPHYRVSGFCCRNISSLEPLTLITWLR